MTTRNFRVHNGISVGDVVIDASTNKITGLATSAPSADGDVATKKYVDDSILTKDNTDEIAEGSTNLFFTNARADARITNALKDEDNMASDSATHVPSQQSVKAYVDAQDAAIAGDTLTFTNKTIDANGTGNAISNIDSGNFLSGFFLDEDTLSSNIQPGATYGPRKHCRPCRRRKVCTK